TGMAYFRMVPTGQTEAQWCLSALSFRTHRFSTISTFLTKLGPFGTILTIPYNIAMVSVGHLSFTIPKTHTSIFTTLTMPTGIPYHLVATQHPAQPLTTLINGLGRTIPGQVNDTQTELAVVKVTAGKRYRFRVIGLSCDAPYNFTIHNHKMTIIEADGEYTSPVVADSLWVYAGQRYSVIVNATQPVGNYWIRADPLSSRGPSGFDGGRNSAIFRYDGAPEKEPTTTGTYKQPLNEDDLHALVHPTPPGKPVLGGADIVVPIRQ
ncbi:hypothetical protein H0H92_013079, partial [Tricholoma furcatifolium]